MRTFEDDDYRPEYSILVLRDPHVEWPHEDPEIPRYRDRGDSPTGTFAGSGAGWITAQAPDLADHLVRLELHDDPPPADHADFDDVLETPYRASSGGISLAWVTCGPGDRVDLDLGDAEWFRVRVARRRDDTGGRYHWLLRCWPETALAPPVWLARSEPAWSRVAEDLEAVLRWTSQPPLATTTADLAGRLLISKAELRDGLALAEDSGLLHADGEDPLRLWLGRRAGH